MQVPDATGEDARELPFAEAWRHWGPPDLVAELDRILERGKRLPQVSWAQPCHVNDLPAYHNLTAARAAWLRDDHHAGRLVVTAFDSLGALGQRVEVPAALAKLLEADFGKNELALAGPPRRVLSACLVSRPALAEALPPVALLAAIRPGEPPPGTWVPLGDAPLAFAPAELRSRYERAVAALRQCSPRDPSSGPTRLGHLFAGPSQVGWVGSGGTAKDAVIAARNALVDELRRALHVGELEGCGRLQTSREWTFWPAPEWAYLRLTGSRVGSGIRGDGRVWSEVQVRRPVPEAAVAPAEAEPTPRKRQASVDLRQADAPIVKRMRTLVHPTNGTAPMRPMQAARELWKDAVNRSSKAESVITRLYRHYVEAFPEDRAENG